MIAEKVKHQHTACSVLSEAKVTSGGERDSSVRSVQWDYIEECLAPPTDNSLAFNRAEESECGVLQFRYNTDSWCTSP